MICQNKFTNPIHYISQISQTYLHCSITMATALHRLKSSPSLAWETSTASHLSFDLSLLLLYSTSIHCQIHIYTVARVIFLKTTAAAAAATTKKQICLCFSFKTPSKFMSRRHHVQKKFQVLLTFLAVSPLPLSPTSHHAFHRQPTKLMSPVSTPCLAHVLCALARMPLLRPQSLLIFQSQLVSQPFNLLPKKQVDHSLYLPLFWLSTL